MNTINEELKRLGIETIRENKGVFLSYKNKTIERPWVNNIEGFIKREFNLIMWES